MQPEATIAIVILMTILTIAVFIGQYFFVKKNYFTIPPTKAAIIYGRRHEIKNPKTNEVKIRGFRIVKGGSALVIPLLENIIYLDLKPQNISINLNNILSKTQEIIDFELNTIVKIGETEELLENAANQFSDLSTEDENKLIHKMILKIIEGKIRTIFSTMTFEELHQNRQQIINQLEMEGMLEKMGLVIVSIGIVKLRLVNQ